MSTSAAATLTFPPRHRDQDQNQNQDQDQDRDQTQDDDLVAPGLGRTVLVVDDDPRQLSLARLQLEHAGFKVVVARSATEALNVIEQGERSAIDAVLSDVVMDHNDGFWLCQRMRLIPKLAADTPVVLISADFRESLDRELALAMGATDLVIRTPDFQHVVERLVMSLASAASTTTRNPNVVRSIKPLSSLSSSGTPLTLSALHTERLTHQLVELRKKSTAAETRYEALFENATDMIALLDRAGNVLEVNRCWEDVIGIPRAALVGKPIGLFAPSIDARAMHEVVSGRMERLPMRGANGSTIHVEMTATSINVNGEDVVLCIGRDATRRLAAQERLDASERKYRSLVQNIPNVVWTAQLSGKLTFITANVQAVCGFTAEEMVANDFANIERIHPEDLPAFEAQLAALVDGRIDAIECELRWRHRDETYRWLGVRARTAMGAEGVVCIHGVFSDATERKALESQLHQAQKLETVGQLTAGVAHDFNNVLAVILSSAEFLTASLDGQDERRQDAVDILNAANKAVGLTRQLLSYSRRGNAPIASLNLGTVVTDVEGMLRRVIAKNIALSARNAPNLGLVRAEAGQIEQVIMNLALNARDAMPKGGKLLIETDNIEICAPWARSEGNAQDRYVVLTVTDTGTGMDDATRAKIFQPFFTTKETGTGLGLSTSYGIVRGLGGHIEAAATEKNVGTVFRVYLPRIDEAPVPVPVPVPVAMPASAAPATTAHTEGARPRVICVVDDDDTMRTMLQRILRRRGYHVVSVRDGTEIPLMSPARVGEIDLILSDLNLPGMSGPEIVKRLLQDHTRARVLYMSGSPATKHAASQIEQFVEKPFAIPRLLTLISNLIG